MHFLSGIPLLLLLCLTLLTLSVSDKNAYEMLKAAELGETDKVVSLIKEKGVFITTKNNYGVSALIFAANNGHLELVKKLIELGAKIEDRANNWRTPLICASLWGHFPVVEYLVNNGANVTVYDGEGMTTLMSAIVNGHTHIAKYLLTKGANPLAQNFLNGTALSIARIKNNQEMVALLEPHFKAAYVEESPFLIVYDMIKTQFLWTVDWLIKETKVVYNEVYEYAVERYNSRTIKRRYKGGSDVYNYHNDYHREQNNLERERKQMKEAQSAMDKGEL